ncbi:hypothetical protein AAE478_000398 [Parahypoxylon ruwenzoriense]
MPVFSLIKRGRAQAKEHNAKQAEKVKEEAVKLPYKHVVTHAALDALSGAPSSWKHTDRPRIMEQNRRRSAMAASENSMTGIPRVGSPLSYAPYVSVYATPLVPLPKNHSYNNMPASWRDPLANPQENPRYYSHPGSAKGKEREYISPSIPVVPAQGLSPGPTGTVSSKGVSSNRSSGNSSSSDDELEIRNKLTNHRPHSLDYRSSLSQKSSSSVKSHHLHPASSRKNIELPVKNHRYYPPAAQSTYFSAPRPLNRLVLDADSSSPLSSNASSSSTSGIVSSASSTASIGIAIASPTAPYSVASKYTPSIEARVALHQDDSKTITASITSAQARPSQAQHRPSIDKYTSSVDSAVPQTSGQSVAPPAPPVQKRRRRLSKSKPLGKDDNGAKMSIETIRPTKPSAVDIGVEAIDLAQTKDEDQKKENEATVIPINEPVRKITRRLSKSSETKPSQKGRWLFKFSSRTPAIVAA